MISSAFYGDGPVPLEDFPKAQNAVILCEQLQEWDMYRRTADAEGIVSLKRKMKESLTHSMEMAKAANDPRAEAMQAALDEWDEPDFLLYLKRKMW